MKQTFIFFFLINLIATKGFPQFTDSLHLTIGSTATFANKPYQPLWITANKFGTISQQNLDVSSHLKITNRHDFFGIEPPSPKQDSPRSIFHLAYGLDIYNNNHLHNSFLKEAYLKAGYKSWELRGGRYEEIIGEVDPEISSGSFAVSSNALPIPKISFLTSTYKSVPFTNGWLQFKGQVSHGWLGKTNYVKGSLLHEKNFYLKVGKDRFYIYGGLNHFAQWAGRHPSGKAPSRFKDFLRIVVGASGDPYDSVYQQGPVDIVNAVGNHLLIPDFGIGIRAKQSLFKIYTQNIFEKGKGRGPNERDRIAGLKSLGKDRLVGVSWVSDKNSILDKIALEGIYTKDQGGPVVFLGRDNYYNNATYATGWEYQNAIIGTPLFINRFNAQNYKFNTNTNVLNGWNIVSNRVKGIHLGIQGSITEKLKYHALSTYLNHYGNYYNSAAFTPSKKQGHFLLQGSYVLNNTIISGGIAQDAGELSTNTGGLLKVEWYLK